jgi:hypothetical protein
MQSVKEWDLNIFYKDLGHDEDGVNQWENVFTINPCMYIRDGERCEHVYADESFQATFAETRYIASERPMDEWGDDWFETMENFLEIAPVRIKNILLSLPHADEISDAEVKALKIPS